MSHNIACLQPIPVHYMKEPMDSHSNSVDLPVTCCLTPLHTNPIATTPEIKFELRDD